MVHINDFTFSKAFECDGFHAKSTFSFKRFLKGAVWSARLGMNEPCKLPSPKRCEAPSCLWAALSFLWL